MAYLVPGVVLWQIGVAEMWGAFLEAHASSCTLSGR